MSGSYRDELDAALNKAEALGRENAALQQENAALREGATPPRANADKRRAALVAVAGCFVVAMGMGMTMSMRAMHPPAVDSLPVSLGATPSSEDVDRAFANITSQTDICRTGLQHAVTMSITFDSTGAVSQAQLVSPAELSATGQCLANAVRTARVPPFTQQTYTVRKVFIL